MKINLIQFVPYFPPHRWWLETVAEELWYYYAQAWYWEVINVTFDVGQDISNPSLTLPLSLMEGNNQEVIINKSWKIIWYKTKGYSVYLLPSFDIIPNFPVPKFWKKEFWEILKKITPPAFPKLPPHLRGIEGELKNEKWIIQTHTRFFLSSLLGWLFAKYHKIKWVHVEHGSDYVILSSTLKNKISYLYDRLIGKWIFKNADSIVAISEWVKAFIQNEFEQNEKIEIIYNGIHFSSADRIDNKEIIKIWFVWRLVKLKWVDLLIQAFQKLEKKYPNIDLEILWDGDEREFLEKSSKWEKIKFLWLQNREFIANNFLPKIDILVNPSFQEWLPTTVLEGLLAGCVVVATDVGGTKEISSFDDLIIIEKWSTKSLETWLEKAIWDYRKLSWKSKEFVKAKFDWSENIKKYFSLYNKL